VAIDTGTPGLSGSCTYEDQKHGYRQHEHQPATTSWF
jgi:hypothetical protein